MGLFTQLINGFRQSVDVVLNPDGSVPVTVVASAGTTPQTPAAAAAAAGASAGVDRSGNAGTGSVVFMPANTARRNFYFKNDSTVDMWISPTGVASAAPGGGNLKVAANGGYYEQQFSTGAWAVIASATAAFTAREF